jgi:hypothetical protein
MATLADIPPRREGRPRWQLPLVALGILLYALLFGEMFLRAMKPQALVPRYVTGAPDGVRANVPGASFRQWTPEVDVTIRYNAAGMRDDRPPPPLARPAGECRIALLGDSYFVGFESGFSDSFAARLEAALAARGRPCRVLNFAVSGFGQAEMLATLESRVLPYRPDLLLMSVHYSDGRDNVRAGLYRLGPAGLEPTGVPYLPGVAISDRLADFALYRWAQENSHLYSALREWAGSMGKRLLVAMQLRATAAPAKTADTAADADAAEDADDGLGDGKSQAWIGNRALNRALVAAIARDAEIKGAKLMLFEIPSSASREKRVAVAARLLGEDLLAATPHATPMAAFDAVDGPEVKLYLEKGHKHWTAVGNKAAADAAADTILAQGLVPRAG